jgi:diadenosine tetraphosphate (Ap4A) HIT family hydrolase/5-methylcytosine-specific restriction endonuclease McrA
LSSEERQKLIEVCNEKLAEYIEKRGAAIWDHRRRSQGYVPGSLRYEVIKRASGRCEACGISNEEKALEVDHILPRNKGGGDDLENLQALCFTCNAQKRDRDDTNFAEVRASYAYRDPDCPFCELRSDRVLFANSLAIAFRDAYPVTPLHTLIIPRRHLSDYFELYQPEATAIHALTKLVREDAIQKDRSISGFNIGVNSGAAAGQTVFHVHVHLIPRREGDADNPRGGVRGVIPGMADYTFQHRTAAHERDSVYG